MFVSAWLFFMISFKVIITVWTLISLVTFYPVAMEDLCRKIPLISKTILEKLDDKSFVNFKDASREIITNLKNERFYWIRVLRSYNCLLRDFKDSWSIVVNRTPAEFVRKIVALIDQFYKDDCYAEDKRFFFWLNLHLLIMTLIDSERLAAMHLLY